MQTTLRRRPRFLQRTVILLDAKKIRDFSIKLTCHENLKSEMRSPDHTKSSTVALGLWHSKPQTKASQNRLFWQQEVRGSLPSIAYRNMCVPRSFWLSRGSSCWGGLRLRCLYFQTQETENSCRHERWKTPLFDVSHGPQIQQAVLQRAKGLFRHGGSVHADNSLLEFGGSQELGQ